MPHPLGLESLTVLGMGPVQHATLAADLGCTAISIGLEQVPPALNPHGYAAWSLRDDAALRRELAAAVADRGIALSAAEGLSVSAEADAASRASDMDLLAHMGVRRINAIDRGAERQRAFDQLAALADMAAERGMDFSIEFCPAYTLRSLGEALDAVRYIGEGRATVLIDTLHLFRSGGTVRDIAQLDPAVIGHIQLSDAARTGEGDYLTQATTGRMIPGQGELPLREFVEALPRGKLLGLEVPLPSAARNGRLPLDYVGEIVRRTRDFLL